MISLIIINKNKSKFLVLFHDNVIDKNDNNLLITCVLCLYTPTWSIYTHTCVYICIMVYTRGSGRKYAITESRRRGTGVADVLVGWRLWCL